MAKREDCVVVSTTVQGRERAERLARQIVDCRLAACVQHFPIRSVYRWKGAVETATEHLLLAKTRKTLAPKLMAFVRKRHSYEVPEITVMPITDGLPEYLAWIADATEDRARQDSRRN